MARTKSPPVQTSTRSALLCDFVCVDPENSVWMFSSTSALTGQDGAGWAGPGSLCVRTDTADLYVQGGSKAAPDWRMVTASDVGTLSISGIPVTTATQDSPYAGFTVTGAGGTAPYTYSIFSGTMPGITVDQNTGVVSGTPIGFGSYGPVVLRVTDSASAHADLAPFSIEVATILDPTLAVFVGASLEANNHSIDGSASSNAELRSSFRAPFVMANALAGSPLKIMASFERTLTAQANGVAFLRRGSNMGFGSRTMISIDEVVRKRVANSKAGVNFMSPGRNWVGNSNTSLAEQWALYQADAALERARGVLVGHIGIGCKPTYAEGDSNFNAVVAMDTNLRAEAALYNEPYLPVAEATHLAGASNLYTSDPAFFGDQTHYNGLGGARVALEWTPVLEQWFGSWLDIDAELDNHDTALFGYNRNTNPHLELTGANGSKSGTGITPETIVPTGYVLYGSSSTVTVAGAFVIREGRPWYQLTITPPGVPGAAQTIRIVRNQGSPAGFYEYGCRVEVEENTSLIYCSPRLLLNAAPTATTSVMAKNDLDATNNLLGGYEAMCRGMVLEHLGSGTPTTELRMQIDPAGTTPFIIWTTSWLWVEVDHKGNFPDDSVIRQTDGENEGPSA